MYKKLMTLAITVTISGTFVPNVFADITGDVEGGTGIGSPGTAVETTTNSRNTTDSNNTDSQNPQSSTGTQSPILNRSSITDAAFVDPASTTGSQSPILTQSQLTDSPLVHQSTQGAKSPNLSQSNINDSAFVDQYSTGGLSPVLTQSKFDNLAQQSTKGDASPNIQDAEIKDSAFVGGNQDNSYWSHNTYHSTGQVNLLHSNAEDLNVADRYSTILDGDVKLGYASGMDGAEPWAGAVNINTGIAHDSVIGDYSAQFTKVGIGLNNTDFGADKLGAVANLNNNQSENYNIIGK